MRLKMFILVLLVGSTPAASALAVIPAQASPSKAWTFMVYLAADNNLEEFGLKDMDEMETVGSTVDVDIVVQIDRIPGHNFTIPDWTGTRRYYVTSGSSYLVDDLGEMNMGDPSTLVNFIEWTIDTYPADKYCLVMWGHGAGYLGVCWDDTDEDYLTIAELRSALSVVQTLKGVTVDVIAFDACLMGLLEIVYEIGSLAHVVVASEESVPGDGAPYDTILDDLTTNPSMDETDLGQAWVERYGDYYDDPAHPVEEATMAAIETSAIYALASAVDQFATSLIDALPPGKLAYLIWRQMIGSCRRTAEEYGGSFGERQDLNFVDLFDLAEISSENIPVPEVQNKAVLIMSRVDSAVIAEWHGPSRPGSHGLSIFFPQRKGQYAAYGYPDMALSVDFNWDEFLETYLAI